MAHELLHSITLCLGIKGTEKTLSLQYLVERHRQRGHVFVVQDDLDQWAPKRGLFIAHDKSAEWCAEYAIWLTWHLGCGVTLVLDEVHRAYPSKFPLTKGNILTEIALVGRNAKPRGRFRRRGPVCLLAASQKPKNVSTDLRELADRIYLGLIWSPADVEWIEDACGKGWGERLSHMDLGQFYALDMRPAGGAPTTRGLAI
jgi:hypothetical protein